MLRRALVVVVLAAVVVSAALGAVPADPLAANWAYESVGLPAAWELETGAPNVVIAVMDSGVDPTHPDLVGALLPGHNFVDENADTSDPFGHGTAVAGIL